MEKDLSWSTVNSTKRKQRKNDSQKNHRQNADNTHFLFTIVQDKTIVPDLFAIKKCLLWQAMRQIKETQLFCRMDMLFYRHFGRIGRKIVIEISHLSKKYGDQTAVDDLTLHIESGKIYGFLGPNGAGKSTTMNMITGYIAATEGTVKINGFDIFKQPEQARKCVGYLPEQPPLYMDMTVAEYLKFAANLKKIPKEKKRRYIDEAMELTKITDMKNRLIRNLSKGYRQRVGFAQAVLGYPEVIILDEPTVGLDPQQMIEIRSLIRSLGKKHTVILSSHILSEVKEVCEHIFIISKGRLAASDTTQNLIEKMSGEQEIRLLIKGEKDAVMQIIPQADGVASVSVTKDKEEGYLRAVLRADKGADIREQVFFAFAKAGIPILEMTAAGKSLEQVFLELTDQSRSQQEHMQKEQEDMQEDSNSIQTDSPGVQGSQESQGSIQEVQEHMQKEQEDI